MNMDIAIVDENSYLFDIKSLNQVCYGMKNIPYNLTICDDMSELCNDDDNEDSTSTRTDSLCDDEKADIKMKKFPLRLYEILQNDSYSSIICWCSHGKGFTVYNKGKFQDEIMPNYFKSSKWPTFLKQLNLYGFLRMRENNIIVFHRLDFVKNKPNAVNQIKRASASKEKTQSN